MADYVVHPGTYTVTLEIEGEDGRVVRETIDMQELVDLMDELVDEIERVVGEPMSSRSVATRAAGRPLGVGL